MKIQDFGQIDTPILLFGGVYSNLHALEALWIWAERAGIPEQNRICTGDIVAYCADAAHCLDILLNSGSQIIAGNCEEQLAADADDCGCGFDAGSACSLYSVAWYRHARAQMSDDLRRYMAALPSVAVIEHFGKRYAIIHGGASETARFLWSVSSETLLQREIDILNEVFGSIDGVIAGHSGIPFERMVGDVHWINAGAIGMPAHDRSPDTHFAVLRNGALTFHQLKYDAAAAQTRMIEVGLTQGYHETLISGVWPSEDTLPEELHHSANG
ncbi:MAG: metallophosphoesterase [Pseudomonadota bacterium]